MAQQQTAGIAPFTVSTDFVRSISSGDRRALAAAAQRILESRNLLQVDVRAADGSLLARASILPSPRRLGVGSRWIMRSSHPSEDRGSISSVPVTASGHGGRQIGTVVAAGQLGDDVLQAVAQRAGTPASVYVDGLPGGLVAGRRRARRSALRRRGTAQRRRPHELLQPACAMRRAAAWPPSRSPSPSAPSRRSALRCGRRRSWRSRSRWRQLFWRPCSWPGA